MGPRGMGFGVNVYGKRPRLHFGVKKPLIHSAQFATPLVNWNPITQNAAAVWGCSCIFRVSLC